MTVPEVFQKLQPYLRQIVQDSDLAQTTVEVSSRVLTTQEAIGNPHRHDFPLQKGKEKLTQAVIGHGVGQAFTDMPGNFTGTLQEALSLPPTNNRHRAIIIAALNAHYRQQNLAAQTIHCKDNGPQECARQLPGYISKHYGQPRIAFFGLQPALVEELAPIHTMRVFDLDPDNIGQKKFGITILNGETEINDTLDWCDLLLVTGSTIVNGSIDFFLNLDKPVIFFGTTIAAAAEILNLNRYCIAAT